MATLPSKHRQSTAEYPPEAWRELSQAIRVTTTTKEDHVIAYQRAVGLLSSAAAYQLLPARALLEAYASLAPFHRHADALPATRELLDTFDAMHIGEPFILSDTPAKTGVIDTLPELDIIIGKNDLVHAAITFSVRRAETSLPLRERVAAMKYFHVGLTAVQHHIDYGESPESSTDPAEPNAAMLVRRYMHATMLQAAGVAVDTRKLDAQILTNNQAYDGGV